MFDWLERTRAAILIQESLWGYPIVLSGHAVGMAVLVGLVLMINFRLLGFAPRMPLASLSIFIRVAMLGLVVNVVSGSMLFAANASGFVESTPFRVKILLLLVGGILLYVVARRLPPGASTAPSRGMRVLAAVSCLVWIGVIVSGRLIAYVDVDYY